MKTSEMQRANDVCWSKKPLVVAETLASAGLDLRSSFASPPSSELLQQRVGLVEPGVGRARSWWGAPRSPAATRSPAPGRRAARRSGRRAKAGPPRASARAPRSSARGSPTRSASAPANVLKFVTRSERSSSRDASLPKVVPKLLMKPREVVGLLAEQGGVDDRRAAAGRAAVLEGVVERLRPRSRPAPTGPGRRRRRPSVRR